jgi:hypothetical protein
MCVRREDHNTESGKKILEIPDGFLIVANVTDMAILKSSF